MQANNMLFNIEMTRTWKRVRIERRPKSTNSPRGRVASIAQDVTPAAKPTSPQAVKAAGGSGWYHEAAIEDAERALELTLRPTGIRRALLQAPFL